MDYNQKLEESREYLTALSITYKEVLHLLTNSKNKKTLTKQEDIFVKNLLEKGDFKSFSKKTSKNLKKNKDFIDVRVKNEIKSKLNSRHVRDDLIDRITRKVKIEDLKDLLDVLANEYKTTLDNVNAYKERLESTQKRENQIEEKKKITPKKEIELTEEQKRQKELDRYSQRIETNSKQIINGPKKNSVFSRLNGIDKNAFDIEFLYGLSMDILVLMSSDQSVNVKSAPNQENIRISNAYIGLNYDLNHKKEQIFKQYGVTSLDGLLNKYEQIRNMYFKNYNKLSDEKKAKYEFNQIHFSTNSSSLEIGSLKIAYQNANYKFPPSKEEMIKAINLRIANGENYDLVTPKAQEGHKSEEPKDILDYSRVKRYYENLTKNMTIEEISRLYYKVDAEINNKESYVEDIENNLIEYHAVMQKLFCEIIFERKGMKISDQKQYDAQLIKIAEEDLKQTSYMSAKQNGKVEEDLRKERQETVYAEYLKYYATQKDKENALKFSTFAEQKYGLKNIQEPETLEEDLKGMKK